MEKNVEGDERLVELIEEVNSLRKRRLSLMIRRHYLLSRISIPRPLSFKEYEKLTPPPEITTKVDSLNKINLVLKSKLYYLCGVKFAEANGILRGEFSVACGPVYYEGFFVEIKKIENNLSISSYNVPLGVDMNEIKSIVPIETYEHIPLFFNYLHRCLRAYFHRKQQVSDFEEFCSSQDIDMSVFQSHHGKYLEFEIPCQVPENQTNESISLVKFTLHYKSDSFIPTKGSYEKRTELQIDESTLNMWLNAFLTKHLREAMRNVILSKIKHEKLSPLEKTASSSLRQSSNKSSILKSQISLRHSSLGHKSNRNRSNVDDLSANISAITVSEVGDKPVIPEKISKLRPIASSTPFVVRRHRKNKGINEKSVSKPSKD